MGGRFVLVGITAPTEVRFRRFIGRRQDGDSDALSAFLEIDDRDRGVGQPSDGQQVERCLALVRPENLYHNVGTLDEFRDWLTDLVERCLRAG